MPEQTDKSTDPVLRALRLKAGELLAERDRLAKLRDEFAEKIRGIDGELFHLMNAARIFGDDVPKIPSTHSVTVAAERANENLATSPSAIAPAPPTIPPGTTIPKIKDMVLDRLKAAGDKGAKASEIRQFIESTYGIEIHEKTVGMNLYRYLKAGKARREGITWFFVPLSAEKKNPGGSTPGQRRIELL